MLNFLMNSGGIIFASLGAFLATSLAGIGSARGTGLVGKAAAGVIADEPEKFGQALLLQLLPGTQGLYGFIVAVFIVLKMPAEAGPISLAQGIYLLFAALPVALIGYRSAIYQAEVSTAALQILVKNPNESTKGIMLAAIVETYAILGLVISIILVVATYPASK